MNKKKFNSIVIKKDITFIVIIVIICFMTYDIEHIVIDTAEEIIKPENVSLEQKTLEKEDEKRLFRGIRIITYYFIIRIIVTYF